MNLLSISNVTDVDQCKKQVVLFQYVRQRLEMDNNLKLFTCLYGSSIEFEVGTLFRLNQSSANASFLPLHFRDLSNVSNHNLSRIVTKPDFCLCENKGESQLRGNREADQRLCFRYSDSKIPLLLKSEISSF